MDNNFNGRRNPLLHSRNRSNSERKKCVFIRVIAKNPEFRRRFGKSRSREDIATLLLLLLAATLAQNRWEDRAIAAPFRLLGGGEARSVSRFIAERLVNKSGDLFFPRLASERDHRIRARESRYRSHRGLLICEEQRSGIGIDNNAPLSLLSLSSFSLHFLPISLNHSCYSFCCL